MLLHHPHLLIDWLRHPVQGRARAWLLGLALWLCAMQWLTPTLGLIHQVLHHGGAVAVVDVDRVDGEVLAEPLFDGHSLADCQLFDQMALGVALTASSVPRVLAPAVVKAAWSVQALLLRQSPALFFARGPPI